MVLLELYREKEQPLVLEQLEPCRERELLWELELLEPYQVAREKVQGQR